MIYSYDRMSQGQRRRRQKGRAKLQRQRRYRRQRSKAKRQSAMWRNRHRSQVKRYQKRYRRSPQRFKMRMADEVYAFEQDQVPFWDLEHGMEGDVLEVNPETETLQAVVGGQPKEYDVLDFLNDTVFMDPQGEADLLGVLDETYDYDDSEPDDEDLAALEGGGEMTMYSYDRTKMAARVEQEAKRRVQQSPLWAQLDPAKQKKLLSFLNDPLYAAVFAAKSKPEMDKAFESLRSIRGIRDFAHMRRVMGI